MIMNGDQKMRKAKAICNYCGKKTYLYSYLQFTMCNDCIEKVKKQISVDKEVKKNEYRKRNPKSV